MNVERHLNMSTTQGTPCVVLSDTGGLVDVQLLVRL